MKKFEEGLFIVLEGAEACGKSTILKSIEERYGKKYLIHTTREPGSSDSELAETIREHLKNDEMDSFARLFLNTASRYLNVQYSIVPYLNDGYIVICDRFTMSTLVYQGYIAHDSIPMHTIKYMNEIATHGLNPNMWLVLEASPDVVLKRLEDRTHIDVFDNPDNMEYHSKLRSGYRMISKMYDNVETIDADLPLEKVKKKVFKLIDNLIEEERKSGHVMEASL